jgi:hypothetical protein
MTLDSKISDPRGRVSFTHEDQTYVLAFTVNALCELETELDLPASEIGKKLETSIPVRLVRQMFWAGLLEHNPLSLKQTGALMSAIGTQAAFSLVVQAFVQAFPAEDATAPARP